MPPKTATDIQEKLIAYIRAKLGQADIAYTQDPVLVREGRRLTTFSFRLFGAPKEFSDQLILRLYADTESPVRPHLEAAILNSVSSNDYPAPKVRYAESDKEHIGAPFLIMDHCRGNALFDIRSLLDKPYMATAQFAVSGIGPVARELAALTNTLHVLDTSKLVEELKSFKFPVELLSLNGRLYQLYKRVQNTRLTELEPGVIWLISHGPPEPVRPSLCHGQLYPNNVRKHKDAISGVINWSMDSILIGDPAYDVGRTSAACRCIVPVVTSALKRVGSGIGKRLAKQYVQAYRNLRPVSQEKIHYFEMLWCIDIAVTAGESLSAKSAVFRKEFDDAYVDLYRTATNALEYFKEHTEVSVSLPLIRRP
jgi:aminoglycoside phosphotransferase (APT) family kinase protein